MKTLQDKLARLQEMLVDDFLRRLESGEMTPSEKAAAIRLLKDNEITCEVTPGDPTSLLKAGLDEDVLPFPVKMQRAAGA